MSRSYKKPIHKDKGWKKPNYWKTVRSHQKNQIRSGVYPEDVKNPKAIINDYSYSDYSTGHHLLDKPEEHWSDWEKQWAIKLKRK